MDALSFMSVKTCSFFRGFKVLVSCGSWARAFISSFPEMLRSHIKPSSDRLPREHLRVTLCVQEAHGYPSPMSNIVLFFLRGAFYSMRFAWISIEAHEAQLRAPRIGGRCGRNSVPVGVDDLRVIIELIKS